MFRKKKIVIFASGSGTNFINLNENLVHGEIVLLVSNNSNCGAIKYAQNKKIKFEVINEKIICDNLDFCYEKILNRYNPDLILLAGFMKKIPINIVNKYPFKIINIHPSLLPKYGGKGYYGMKVHEAVINAKETISGATVHFIDGMYDNGPIIKQAKVTVEDNDDAKTLSKKVLKKEYELYLNVVEMFCCDKIRINENKVIINE